MCLWYCISLPLNVPATPAFGREVFQHNIKPIIPDMGYDDTYVMNTQSSTQWDGFRHVSLQTRRTPEYAALMDQFLLNISSAMFPPKLSTMAYDVKPLSSSRYILKKPNRPKAPTL